MLNGALTIKTGWDEPATLQIPYTLALVHPVRAFPEQADWGAISREEITNHPERSRMRIVIQISENAEKSLKPGRPVSSTKFVNVVSFTPINSGRQFELILELSPETPPGALNETITLPVQHKRMKGLTLPLRAQVR